MKELHGEATRDEFNRFVGAREGKYVASYLRSSTGDWKQEGQEFRVSSYTRQDGVGKPHVYTW